MEKPILNKESFPFGGIVQVKDTAGTRSGGSYIIPFLRTLRGDSEVTVIPCAYALSLNPEIVPARYEDAHLMNIKDLIGLDATSMISEMLKAEFVNQSTLQIVNTLLGYGDVNRPRGWFEKLVRVFNRKYVRRREVCGTADMVDVLRKMRADISRRSGKNADYVIVNTKLGAILADLCYVNNGEILLKQQQQPNVMLYPVGKFMGMTIYVYPFMKWDDERILMGASTADGHSGVYFVFDSNSAEFITIHNMPCSASQSDEKYLKIKVDCSIANVQDSPRVLPACQVEYLRVTKNVI